MTSNDHDAARHVGYCAGLGLGWVGQSRQAFTPWTNFVPRWVDDSDRAWHKATGIDDTPFLRAFKAAFHEGFKEGKRVRKIYGDHVGQP